jgi:hypothetical protein
MTHREIKTTATLRKLIEPPQQQEIAEQAYAIWLARAFQPGSPAEDWLRADQKVRGSVGTVTLRRTSLGNFLVS